MQKSINLTSALKSYLGKSVEVYFQGRGNATLSTTFYVDDVDLGVTLPGMQVASGGIGRKPYGAGVARVLDGGWSTPSGK